MAEQPEFKQQQYAFAAHLRDPQRHPPPTGVAPDRLAVYRNLFFNNIAGLLSGTFPVLKSILQEQKLWRTLIRRFYADHRCSTPYFMQVPREFIDWLAAADPPEAPPFALELAHYEWIELALTIDETELPLQDIDPDGDLLYGRPAVSPLAWSLVYAWPVHRLAAGRVPDSPGHTPTRLVVYRNPEDLIGFIEINHVTARLLELLRGVDEHSGESALKVISSELRETDTATIIEAGSEILEELRQQQVILGSWSGRPAA